jgi:hypothetical protein
MVTYTLGGMKDRIANELARADLTDEIADAIQDAVAAYQFERYFYNESRTRCTFNTVAAQQDYTSADNSDIPNILSIDYFTIVVGGSTTFLTRETPEVIEDLSSNQSATGQPYAYTYYNQILRLYPIPGDVYAARVAGRFLDVFPTSDSEFPDNWMVWAERLIRSRAKYELAIHVLRDPDLAALMKPSIDDAEAQIKGRTNLQQGSGLIQPTQF